MAVATQNMALAARSLGLASYWVGVYQIRNGRGSVENELKKLLDIPVEYRLISLLSIGKPEGGKQPAPKTAGKRKAAAAVRRL